MYEKKALPKPYRVQEISIINRVRYILDDGTIHTDIELMSFEQMKDNNPEL